jgi:uncharacterized SAM-binding protein YcdF (DUF218 family)
VPTRLFSFLKTHRRSAAALLAAALVALGLVTTFRHWSASLSRPPDPLSGKADAIVSLAGGSGRLSRGLDLLLAGKADVLLLSGTGKGSALKDIFPVRVLSALSPGQVIVLEDRSTSTYENAIEAWAVLSSRRSEPLREIVLLTSNYHMLRADFVFRKVFPREVAIRDFPIEGDVRPDGWWGDGHARKIVLVEYFKWIWYRLRY